jgi:hypothetical protein
VVAAVLQVNLLVLLNQNKKNLPRAILLYLNQLNANQMV